jgi:hypothetical protein
MDNLKTFSEFRRHVEEGASELRECCARILRTLEDYSRAVADHDDAGRTSDDNPWSAGLRAKHLPSRLERIVEGILRDVREPTLTQSYFIMDSTLRSANVWVSSLNSEEMATSLPVLAQATLDGARRFLAENVDHEYKEGSEQMTLSRIASAILDLRGSQLKLGEALDVVRLSGGARVPYAKLFAWTVTTKITLLEAAETIHVLQKARLSDPSFYE